MAVPLTSVMGIMVTYAIFKHELFEFSPKSILSSIGEGIISVNRKKEIIQVNEAAEELLGSHQSHLLGKRLSHVIGINDERGKRIPLYKRPVTVAIRTKKSITSNDYFAVLKNGRTIPVKITASPVIVSGKVEGATMLFRDITREKEAEKIKDDFISIASHELRTPLTSMKMFNQLLKRNLGADKETQTYHFASRMEEQINKVSRLINNFLDVSRISSGKLELHKKLFDMYVLLNDAISQLQQTVEHQLILQGEKHAKVYADADRIEQVVINLLTNAIKYSPKAKKVIITLSSNKDFVKMSVKDFGVGIKPEYQQKVFERFYRVKEATSSHMAGFGIGLYLSAEIIRAHGGKIGVESTLGKGAEFFFEIPRRK